MESSMTDIIYDYFTSRIQFGYYGYGDSLPSISYIRRHFQVSALTVRTAFSRLEDEGYIRTAERRAATVIYRQAGQLERRYAATFLTRKDGMDDICRCSGIIFDPIAATAFRRQNPAVIRQILLQLKKAEGHEAKQVARFYAEAIQQLQNPLALNLYWEVVRYMRLPYLRQPANFGQTNEEAATHIKRILSFARKERFDEAVAEMANFNGNVVQMFLRRLHTAFDREADVQQTPFVWQIYRDRPQVCYTVAAQIIRKIDGNIYRAGELLPSCQALAKEYGVSSMTMRRTLALLGQIRITETINGVGTRVIPQGCKTPPNFSCPQIQKNLLLFLQAYQLCALTCQDVTKHTFSSMDGHGYRALADQIQKIKEAGQIFLLPGVCIQFIGGRSPSPFIREVYEKLSALLLWGHALRIFDRRPEKNEACSRCAVELEKALECRDVTRIAALIFERLHAGVAASKKLLLQLDFAEKALI